jgi:probable blue pigment (indigoidine) exporter
MKTNGTTSGLLVAATLLAPISWGTTYVTVTELLPANRPMLVAALRVAPAAIVLLAVSARRNGGLVAPSHGWGRTVVLSVTNFGAFFPLLILAATRLPGGVAAAAGGLQPLLVGGLTWAVAGERPRRTNVGVGVVAAVGVALVVIRPGAGLDALGVAAAVGSAASFAIGVVLTRRFGAPADAVAAAGWQLAISAALLAPFALAVEGPPPMLTVPNIAGVLYLSLGGTAVAYLLWFRGVRRLPAAAPPLLGLAAPITGATLGWVLLGQSLAPAQLIGLAMAISAVAYGAVRVSAPTSAAGHVKRGRAVSSGGSPYLADERRDLPGVARCRAGSGAVGRAHAGRRALGDRPLGTLGGRRSRR